MRIRNWFLWVLSFLSSCIGIDYFDDPIVDPILSISSNKSSVIVGESIDLMASYSNEYGLKEDVPISWESSNVKVATIVDDKILGVTSGQTIITASHDEIISNSIQLTVVSDLNEVASVEILLDEISTQLTEGASLQLTASSFNIEGTILLMEGFSWNSTNTAVLDIDNTGLVSALSTGSASVTATIDEVTSESIDFTVGPQVRNGTFQGVNGYHASGSVNLEINASGNLNIILSDDFEADIALGTFIYLSNSTSGPPTRAGGIELGEITANGGVTYVVDDVGLNDYQYVVVLCKPASLTFGFAEPK